MTFGQAVFLPLVAVHALDAALYGIALFGMKRQWRWAIVLWVAQVVTTLPLVVSRPPLVSLGLLVTAASLIFLLYDPPSWKKLWGKIKSAALTVVQQAAFQRQTKEATG